MCALIGVSLIILEPERFSEPGVIRLRIELVGANWAGGPRPISDGRQQVRRSDIPRLSRSECACPLGVHRQSPVSQSAARLPQGCQNLGRDAPSSATRMGSWTFPP